MFGVADNGEEWNTRTLRAHPTSRRSRRDIQINKRYFYPLLKTRGGVQSGILLVSSPHL